MAQHNFFAYVGRMRFIERWNLMHSVTRENLMEHTAQVAQFAHALSIIRNKFFGGNLDAGHVAALALYHDAAEVITGDLPTPVKYYNEEIRTAFKDLEGVANKKLLSMLPPELADTYETLLLPKKNTEEEAVIKAADRLAAYVKCLEEMKSGNKEFAKALKSTEEALKASPLPEVAYFMEHFIKGFGKTLDELD